MRRFLTVISAFYSPKFLWVLVRQFAHGGYTLSAYTQWFWNTTQFRAPVRGIRPVLTRRDVWLLVGTSIIVLISLAVSVLMFVLGYQGAYPEFMWFGLALAIATPLFAAFLVPFVDMLYILIGSLSVKRLGRAVVCMVLERQVRSLRRKHTFKIVAVAGSMGKTSTKLAIAHTLIGAGLRVRYQEGNYNDRVTVPLVIFDQPLPNILNAIAWMRIFRANRRMIRVGYPYDAVVVEIGSDAPGQITKFSYLQPELAVITAIAPEHMEFFGSLDAVAAEELAIVPHAQRVLLNTDDIADHYVPHTDYEQYGLQHQDKGYFAQVEREAATGQELNIYKHGALWGTQYISFLGSQGRKIVLAAVATADMLELDRAHIAAAVSELRPPAGRMQLLEGMHDSTLIDDTYNATPAAMEAALAVLAALPNKQKIAVLGSMNELGEFSPEAHRTIGNSLSSDDFSLIITLGSDANTYLAPAAKAQGCTVISVESPYEAGALVKQHLKNGAAVLFKGSQNRVFAEEAIKSVLKHPEDEAKLVRQSSYWMSIKTKQFASTKH